MVAARPDGSMAAGARASSRVDHSRDVFSIANVVTVLRLVLIPFFYWALVYGGNDTVAFVLLVLTASTDFLDGLIARRTGAVTEIGKIIDPLVDRLLIAASLVGLYVIGRISLWLLVLLVGRDVYLLYGAWVLERHHGRRIAVTLLGKVTTAVLMVGFAGLVWNVLWVHVPVLATIPVGKTHFTVGGSRPIGAYLVYLGVVLSLSAAVQYTVLARREYRAAVAAERAAAPPAGPEPANG